MTLCRRPHQQQHVSQSINYSEQLPAGGVELVFCSKVFGGCSSGSDARQLDVVRLQFRCAAKVNLQFVERLAKALDTCSDLRFAVLVLLYDPWRRFFSALGLVNCCNATRHTTEQVNKFGQKLDLIRDAGCALGSCLRQFLRCRRRRRRWLLPARAVARLREHCRGSQK